IPHVFLYYIIHRHILYLHSFPTRRSSDLKDQLNLMGLSAEEIFSSAFPKQFDSNYRSGKQIVRELFHRRNQIAHQLDRRHTNARSEEHTSELQSRFDLVCRLLLEKKKKII